MDGFDIEWLRLAARWIHLIVGVAWIGASFYFVWQDDSLEPTPEDPDRKRLQGEVWMVHGGGFYNARKYKVAPPNLPEKLHWFKWEAYSTWLSGVALLILVYYLGADIYMLPPDSPLSPLAAVGIGVGTLGGSWVIYDLMCRSPLGRSDGVLAAAVAVLVALLAYGLTQVLSGRAAFIHVGAAIGTIMVSNVFFTIIPNQRKMVAQMLRGEVPDPALGRTGKQRSVHNTYFTLPVLFLMISNHYAMVTGHPWNWVLLLAISALGAGVRQVFVLRHTGRARAWMLPLAGACFAGLVVAATTTRDDGQASASTAVSGADDEAEEPSAVPFAAVQAIIQARCVACHAARPTFEGFDAPPKEVALETPEQIRQWADKIGQQAVHTRTMPLGNVTAMNSEERALLGLWLRTGK